MMRFVGVAGLLAGMMATGCWGPGENPACVGEDEVVDLDEDVGGTTVEHLASERSGRGTMTEPGRPAVGFTIDTTAIGPATVHRLVNCGDEIVEVRTPVEVALRSDDGRLDLVVDGVLRSEFGGPAEMIVPAIELGELDPGDVVPPTSAATTVVTGLRFDLAGIDGRGSITWTATGPAETVTLAELELPYTVEEDSFGP